MELYTRQICHSIVVQLAWLNDYHKKCRDVVGAELEKSGRHDALSWLQRETEPLV